MEINGADQTGKNAQSTEENVTGNLRRDGIVNDTLPAFETNHALLRGSRRRVIFKNGYVSRRQNRLLVLGAKI